MKILFCDMDGTVINQEGVLHEKDREMMEVLRQKGGKIAFNTGRNYQEASFVLHKYKFPYDYLILNNGAHIVDEKGKEIFRKDMPSEVGKAIIEYSLSLTGMIIFFYTGTRTIGYEKGKTYEHSLHGTVPVDDLDFIEEYQKAEIFDIIALNQEDGQIDKLLKVQAYITENFGNQAAGCLNTEYLDITASGCTKGTGVVTVSNLYKEGVERYCVGDSFNDISMFEVASHSYTFHRVKEDIVRHTDKQVDYVYEIVEDMLKEDR